MGEKGKGKRERERKEAAGGKRRVSGMDGWKWIFFGGKA